MLNSLKVWVAGLLAVVAIVLRSNWKVAKAQQQVAEQNEKLRNKENEILKEQQNDLIEGLKNEEKIKTTPVDTDVRDYFE